MTQAGILVLIKRVRTLISFLRVFGSFLAIFKPLDLKLHVILNINLESAFFSINNLMKVPFPITARASLH